MTDDSNPWLSDRERHRLTRRPSDRAMIATLAATGLIAAFMQTLVTPILPHLPHYLDTTMADASWVLTSTLLAAAIATPIAGRLGDMYGKRRMLLVLLLVMSAGSVICALSYTLVPMVVGRTLQGRGPRLPLPVLAGDAAGPRSVRRCALHRSREHAAHRWTLRLRGRHRLRRGPGGPAAGDLEGQ